MYIAMGAGIVPIPVFDFIVISGIQLDMLRRLSKLYEIEFLSDKGKSLIGALSGGGISSLVGPMLASTVKFVPVVGTTLGALSMPIIAGATTYAVGKVFIQHFESGGTFLNFDPDAVKNYYAELVKEGKSIARRVKSAEEKAQEATPSES
jgi:uncharacterized protein (DUF697 family)